MDAEDLYEGAQVRSFDGDYGTVEDIQFSNISQRIYNLTVEEANTFFVGEEGWLVHNTCWETASADSPPPHTYGLYRYKNKIEGGKWYVGQATNLFLRLTATDKAGHFDDWSEVEYIELDFVGDETPAYWLDVAERVEMYNLGGGVKGILSNEAWRFNNKHKLDGLRNSLKNGTRSLPENWPTDLALPTDEAFWRPWKK